MSATVCTIFNRDGRTVDDSIIAGFKRSWVLNDIGECSFEIPSSLFRESMEYGNLILLESDTFPNWGGVIDIPRSWKSGGTVVINAYSAEYLLTFRRVSVPLELKGDSGTIFQHLIEMANSQYPTRINANKVWRGGDEIVKTLSAQSVFDTIVELAKETGCDWDVIPVVSSENVLSFEANWYQRKGIELKDHPLMEGFNIGEGSPSMEEQAPEEGLMNDILGYGNGSVWDEKIKIISERQASRDLYGVRQGFLQVDTDSPSTLIMAVNKGLDKSSWIRRTFDFDVLNVGDILPALGIGNLYELEMFSCGYSGKVTELTLDKIGTNPFQSWTVQISKGYLGAQAVVRLLGMTADDSKDGAEVVVDEVAR